MVQRPTRALRVLRWAADDVHNRHVLGVAACDRVGGREFADPKCGYHSRHSAQAAVSVGGIPGVELIGVADPPQLRVGDDVVEEFQVVVAGYTEYLGHTEFCEAVQQVVTDGVGARDSNYQQLTGIDGTRLRSKTPSTRRCLAIVRTWQSTRPAK